MPVRLQTVVVVALSGLALAIPAPTKTIPLNSVLDKRTISGVTAADCDGRKLSALFRQLDEPLNI
jgi:hypothetical protein